ncbi:M61 family metallopeptidase [Leeia aquatica]|uniref:M61 family metallopeptidase n=1 Tax=Leeia aquatica TaxID=2725557 RepID=A0A847S3J6_9NEIS|nr:PDZ domain-containing protein [Leeia aquatica]NLR73737.1 M61 family metallopeptidase [Leeia aquatica]
MTSPVAIHYRISLADPHAHLLEVCLTVDHPDPAGQAFTLPAWIPGSYLIREFARNIVTIRAECEGESVRLLKLDKARWQAEPVRGVLQLYYQVYAFDLSVRGAYFDQERAFFNATSTCLAVVGQEQQPVEVELVPPSGTAYQHWQVATTLPRPAGGATRWAFGHYQAPDYDALIDHPVECGTLEICAFDVLGIPHWLAISGRHHGHLPRLVADTTRICQSQIELFGQPGSKMGAPFSEYLFLLYVGGGYGGLEHRSSTALIADRNDLPRPDEPAEPGSGYTQLLGLISHEYFHSWNVKQLKPAAYAPYPLEREAYSRLLWAFEGITSYYDDLMLVRSGVTRESQYLETLAQNLTSVLRTPGCQVQTLEDASFDTWIKYYRQDENSPNALASYYVKGALVGWLLDMTLRAQHDCSLDDIMRTLWQRYGARFAETGVGIAEDEWERVASEVAGVDLTAFFDTYLRQPSQLLEPLQAVLPLLGLSLQCRMPQNLADKGGKWLAEPPAPRNQLGARTATDPLGLKLSSVLSGGAAELAGLAGGDVIIALDGFKVSQGNLETLLDRLPLGAETVVHAFRRDELKTLPIRLQTSQPDTAALQVMAEASDSCHARRKAWLQQN